MWHARVLLHLLPGERARDHSQPADRRGGQDTAGGGGTAGRTPARGDGQTQRQRGGHGQGGLHVVAPECCWFTVTPSPSTRSAFAGRWHVTEAPGDHADAVSSSLFGTRAVMLSPLARCIASWIPLPR